MGEPELTNEMRVVRAEPDRLHVLGNCLAIFSILEVEVALIGVTPHVATTAAGHSAYENQKTHPTAGARSSYCRSDGKTALRAGLEIVRMQFHRLRSTKCECR